MSGITVSSCRLRPLREAVELSVRYLPGRCLPDKAIDLVDEACAAARIRAEREHQPSPVLTREEVAQVVARASGIPAERVGEKERERLARLEARLNEGDRGPAAGCGRRGRGHPPQPHRAGEPGRPIGAMLFLGPTGVGKNSPCQGTGFQLVRQRESALKFDMSEYQEQHTVARLLGAPPGYLGHDEGGQLTEAVRRRPYSVVLFDEIEKAHPDIQNILLQLLEDGQLTDSMGRKADFRNTIVLLTSNLGARFLAGQSAPLGFAAGSEAAFEKQSEQAVAEAKKWFRPELIGRLDEIIVFRPSGRRQSVHHCGKAAGPAGDPCGPQRLSVDPYRPGRPGAGGKSPLTLRSARAAAAGGPGSGTGPCQRDRLGDSSSWPALDGGLYR